MKRSRAFCILTLLCIASQVRPAEHPKLVIYISVDQMKEEYLEWYRAEFTSGFRRFLTEGTWYANADLNYAMSETGPGHAALSTGTYPQHSGILSNEWRERKTHKLVYCVGDTTANAVGDAGPGASPRPLVVTGLADWLKRSSPNSKVITVSIKDRAAILMGGQHPDHAFWYDHVTGHMITSDYYERELPAWVKTFNSRDWIANHLPDAWTKLLPDSIYAKYGPDTMDGEMKWNGSTAFPHAFQRDKRNEQLLTTPFGDAMTLDFARQAVDAERLGQRGVTDMLMISLSCTDYIGHAFGGNSHEMIDQMIRLDREFGDFVAAMEKRLGSGAILVAMSADHGCLPLPEYRTMIEHKPARRILLESEFNPGIKALDQGLRKRLNTAEPVIQADAFLNYAAADRAQIDSAGLEHLVRDGLLKIDGIADVYFRRELMDLSTPQRPYLGYYQRGYYAPRGADFVIRPCEYCLLTTSLTGTTHGTAYRYDTHVPVLFWGLGIARKKSSRVIHSVDIAPTLARYLGIDYPSTIDGRALREIAR